MYRTGSGTSGLFQFTPLREGRPCPALSARVRVRIFQFTPLREGRRGRNARPTSLTYFNSRPCGRGDCLAGAMAVPLSDFNSRPCGRGDPPGDAGGHHGVYFNSRPCGRGDGGQGLDRHSPCLISIHAPAGGATRRLIMALKKRKISIHAPAGGATMDGHRPHRADRISIHAPAGGATVRPAGEGGRAHHFNSRPCGRGDSKRVQKKKMTIVPFAEKRGKFILL